MIDRATSPTPPPKRRRLVRAGAAFVLDLGFRITGRGRRRCRAGRAPSTGRCPAWLDGLEPDQRGDDNRLHRDDGRDEHGADTTSALSSPIGTTWVDATANAAAVSGSQGYRAGQDPDSLYTVDNAIGARAVWWSHDSANRQVTGQGVVLALLDTGVARAGPGRREQAHLRPGSVHRRTAPTWSITTPTGTAPSWPASSPRQDPPA